MFASNFDAILTQWEVAERTTRKGDTDGMNIHCLFFSRYPFFQRLRSPRIGLTSP
jgi:hypothetical protein